MALTVLLPHTMDMGGGCPSPSWKSAIWRLRSKSRYVLASFPNPYFPGELLIRLLAHCRFATFFLFLTIIKAAISRFEEAVIEGGPIALPAAQSLLSQIDAGSSPSARGWTIVTSGTYPSHLSYPLFPHSRVFFRLTRKSSDERLYPKSTLTHRHTSACSGLRNRRRRRARQAGARPIPRRRGARRCRPEELYVHVLAARKARERGVVRVTCGLSTRFRHGRSRGGRCAVGAARRTQGGSADARGVHFAHARQDRRLRCQPGFYRERSYQV
jgi:hypothetical protein